MDPYNTRRFIYEEDYCIDGMNIDSENAERRTVTLYGYEATILSKGDSVMIYWYDGNTLYMVDTDGYSIDDALKSAKSLRKIK